MTLPEETPRKGDAEKGQRPNTEEALRGELGLRSLRWHSH